MTDIWLHTCQEIPTSGLVFLIHQVLIQDAVRFQLIPLWFMGRLGIRRYFRGPRIGLSICTHSKGVGVAFRREIELGAFLRLRRVCEINHGRRNRICGG